MPLLLAKIAVSKAIYAIDKPYAYMVPPELSTTLQTGMRVLVPFGRGDRGSEGLVLSVEEISQQTQSLKFILSQLDETPVLNQEGVYLALWMREMFYCTLYDCVRAMLPAGLFFALRDTLVFTDSYEFALEKAGTVTLAEKIVHLIHSWGGRGDIQEIRLALGTKDPLPAIRHLLNQEALRLESTAKRNVGDKSEKIVHLAVSPEEAMGQVIPRKKSAPLRFAVIELLAQMGRATVKEICYYTGATSQTVKSLEKSNLVWLSQEEVFRNPHTEEVPPAPPPVLNQEQTQAYQGMLGLLGKPAVALLYGVTGSGKTQVYLALIHKMLQDGKTALVLVPEIALTPQMLRIFAGQFGKQIAILHSSLGVGERYDEWKRVKQGEAKVVLGTRSAIFAPLENIGILILDEEQEQSYKSEQSPRYHAREIAKYRCIKHKALLLLGSATPSVDSMYACEEGRYQLFPLKQRFNQGAMPLVEIVDMKEELRNGNQTCISELLQKEIAKNRQNDEQCILFLNRRGSSRMITCGDCGFVSECPNCNLFLTYHKKNDRLMCHYCSFSQPRPEYCPECGGEMNYVGIGTQQVEEDLKKFSSDLEILRMDTDTVSAAHPHEEMFREFVQKNVPVLVGTQMVAKGLDFENVTLVGVIAADLSLFVDDIWAGERTFSLVTQVVGRAGRGEKLGRALIQTYNPDNDVVLAAARQDYDSFYAQEIILRRLRQYPPYREIILFFATGIHEKKVEYALVRVAQGLRYGVKKLNEPIEILGPTPSPVPKINNRYRFQVTIIAKHSKGLRLLLEQILTAAQQDKENKTVSIHIDRLLH
ncbi:MAG: primosomal protein N' [Eubacteriales bacterium]